MIGNIICFACFTSLEYYDFNQSFDSNGIFIINHYDNLFLLISLYFYFTYLISALGSFIFLPPPPKPRKRPAPNSLRNPRSPGPLPSPWADRTLCNRWRGHNEADPPSFSSAFISQWITDSTHPQNIGNSIVVGKGSFALLDFPLFYLFYWCSIFFTFILFTPFVFISVYFIVFRHFLQSFFWGTLHFCFTFVILVSLSYTFGRISLDFVLR